MMKHGIIKEYDGYTGIIITIDRGKYILLKKEILYENPKIGDIVSFKYETISTEFETKHVARFVKFKN